MQYWRSSSRTTERGRKSVSSCNSLAMWLTQVQLNLAVQGSPTMAVTNSTTQFNEDFKPAKHQKQPCCPLPCHPPSVPAKQLQSQAVIESGESPEKSEPCWLEPWYKRMLREGGGTRSGALKLGLLPNALHSQTTALDSLFSTKVSYLTLTTFIWATICCIKAQCCLKWKEHWEL